MKISKKIFAAIMILSFIILGDTNVKAADLNFDVNEMNFQNLRSGFALPYLPDRIRHRKDSHKLQRPEQKRIELPHRKEPPPYQYTQRHPKQPPKLTTPSRPTSSAARRGTEPPKSFGPPRFR